MPEDWTGPASDGDAPPADAGAGPSEDLGRMLLDRARAARGTAADAPSRRRRSSSPERTRSGPGPDARDPQPVGDLASQLSTEQGWTEGLTAVGVVAHWDVVVGPEVAAHCTADHLEDGVLTVRADSSAWATQVRMLAPQVLARLAQVCGAGTVSALRVLGPGRPSWRAGPLHVSGRGPRDTYG